MGQEAANRYTAALSQVRYNYRAYKQFLTLADIFADEWNHLH